MVSSVRPGAGPRGLTWMGPLGNRTWSWTSHTYVLWLLPEAILQGQQIGSFFKGINLFGQRQRGESDSHKSLEVGKQISEWRLTAPQAQEFWQGAGLDGAGTTGIRSKGGAGTVAESLNKSQLHPHVLAVLWNWATSRPQPWRNPELWSLGRMKQEALLKETRHSWGPGPRWSQAVIVSSSGGCSRKLVTFRLQLLPALEAGSVRGRHWHLPVEHLLPGSQRASSHCVFTWGRSRELSGLFPRCWSHPEGFTPWPHHPQRPHLLTPSPWWGCG